MNYCWFWDLERSFPGYPQVLVEYGLRKIIDFLQFDVADNILGVVNNQVVLFLQFLFLVKFEHGITIKGKLSKTF